MKLKIKIIFYKTNKLQNRLKYLQNEWPCALTHKMSLSCVYVIFTAIYIDFTAVEVAESSFSIFLHRILSQWRLLSVTRFARKFRLISNPLEEFKAFNIYILIAWWIAVYNRLSNIVQTVFLAITKHPSGCFRTPKENLKSALAPQHGRNQQPATSVFRWTIVSVNVVTISAHWLLCV